MKKAALEKAIAEHDLVISLVPYIHHVNVIKTAINGKTDVVTTSYCLHQPRHPQARGQDQEGGARLMNGLDPGVDHLD